MNKERIVRALVLLPVFTLLLILGFHLMNWLPHNDDAVLLGLIMVPVSWMGGVTGIVLLRVQFVFTVLFVTGLSAMSVYSLLMLGL